MNLLVSLDDIFDIVEESKKTEFQEKPSIAENYSFHFDILESIFEVFAAERGLNSSDSQFKLSEVFYIFHSLINEINEVEAEPVYKKAQNLEALLNKVIKENKASKKLIKEIKSHVVKKKKKTNNIFKVKILKGAI